MQHWLLVRGRGERPLQREHGDEVTAHSSSKRPSVQPGDLAILYASVWQAVYGIAEIAGVPERDSSRTRWAWRFPLRSRVVIEVNEAFACVVLQTVADLRLADRMDDVNPNGGGISLGHPLGATGARITSTLVSELERRNARYGIASMCVGFGMAIAGVVERF